MWGQIDDGKEGRKRKRAAECDSDKMEKNKHGSHDRYGSKHYNYNHLFRDYPERIANKFLRLNI